ncbi:4-carboxymuconolactone decarboxylase [Flavobacterium sp. 28YEA47A]
MNQPYSMKIINKKLILLLLITITGMVSTINAHPKMTTEKVLNPKEQSIISIAALTAKGDLSRLKEELNTGLDAGLTVNEIKEILVHLYAYCGFPRSIRGLQTFMEVIEERKAKGINDVAGAEALAIKNGQSKYERGKKILAELTKTQQPDTLTGYSAFAPVIDTFLKEHLFADIFERNTLSYAQRELVTISVIATIGDAEPMLRSHLIISLNAGITPEQLQQFVGVIKSVIGKKQAKAAKVVLDEVLKNNRKQ